MSTIPLEVGAAHPARGIGGQEASPRRIQGVPMAVETPHPKASYMAAAEKVMDLEAMLVGIRDQVTRAVDRYGSDPLCLEGRVEAMLEPEPAEPAPPPKRTRRSGKRATFSKPLAALATEAITECGPMTAEHLATELSRREGQRVLTNSASTTCSGLTRQGVLVEVDTVRHGARVWDLAERQRPGGAVA